MLRNATTPAVAGVPSKQDALQGPRRIARGIGHYCPRLGPHNAARAPFHRARMHDKVVALRRKFCLVVRTREIRYDGRPSHRRRAAGQQYADARSDFHDCGRLGPGWVPRRTRPAGAARAARTARAARGRRPVGPSGPAGQPGPVGAPGQGMPMRLVTAPCPQQCQLSCNDDERVFSFYRVRGAQPTPVVTDDRTVSFGRSNRPASGDAFLFCTKR